MATSRLWRRRRCTLEYHLPVSCVRFKGDVTFTTDEFAADPHQPKESAKATATLEVMAADEPLLKLDVQPMRLCDTKISVAVTDDLRLTTAGFSSTGQAGPVLLGVASAVATVAGTAIGLRAPGVATAAGGLASVMANGGVEGLVGDLDLDLLALDMGIKTAEPKDPWQEYQEHQPDQAELLETCRDTVTALERALAEEAAKLATGSDLDSLSRLSALEKALAVAQAELDRLNSRYDKWRAGKISTRGEQYEYVMSLDDLGKGCSVDDSGNITFDPAAPARAAQEQVWDKLGIAVQVGRKDSQAKEGSGGNPGHLPGQRPNRVVLRIPRHTQLTIYERVGAKTDMKARPVESKPHLIMDKDCRFQAIRLHSSLFGKKVDDITFSDLGGLASYSTERTSGAAGLAQNLSKLPETVTSGLEQSGKMLDQVSGLRSLAATESRAAELALLQWQLALTEAQHKLANLEKG